MKIAIPRKFSSGRATSGNCQPALQRSLWHILVFRTCNVGKKIGLLRTFSSGRVTSGKDETAGVIKEWLVEVEEVCFAREKGDFQYKCALRAVVQNRLVKVPLTERPRRHIRHQTRRFRRVWGKYPLWRALQGTSLTKRF